VKGQIFSPVHKTEKEIVLELFRLRNEHKADSAALYFADTVLVYMKYLRNVPRSSIAETDKQFWKQHPRNRFEITAPVLVNSKNGIVIATIFGKEYLDGTSYIKERIEIRFNRRQKIYYYRGFLVR
jgi:hypothetical protein